MSERIQVSQVLKSQIPNYVREEYPQFEKFLQQYYIGQEYPGGPIDLIENIDKYVKIDSLSNINDSAVLATDISFSSRIIRVDSSLSPQGTSGFPDSYGLLKIGDEVITYKNKTEFSFTGCIRGFSGVTNYRNEDNLGELTFESTKIEKHKSGATIHNLSALFLKEMFTKLKYQFLPGLENKKFAGSVDENLFLQKSRDFYSVKGTRTGFDLLFKLLYGEEIDIISPKNYLFTPSNSDFEKYDEMVLEIISGNPEDLLLSTLSQEEYKDIIEEAYAPITDVEKLDDPDSDGKYYKVKLDSGSGVNRDSGVKGSISGSFTVHAKTRVIGDVEIGASIITVDSTVGFSNEGELYVRYADQTFGVVSYTSKSFNQFFGCSNIINNILDGYGVSVNTFAYATSGDNIVKVRVNSIPSSVQYSDDSYGYHKNLPVTFKNLGYTSDSYKSDGWLYNTGPCYDINRTNLIDTSDNTYEIELKTKNYLQIDDSVNIISSNQSKKFASVIDLISENTILVRCEGPILENDLKVERNILKSEGSIITNVQNVYKHNTEEEYLIASSSIPSLLDENNAKKVTFSGTFLQNQEILKISEFKDHGFYTGDAIFYKPEVEIQIIEDADENEEGFTETEVIKSSLFDEGLYFIKRISPTEVKFALSLSNIEKSQYISPKINTIVENNTLEPYKFKGKEIRSQNLVRKLKNPQKTSEKSKTIPGFTGIMINGTEILNYKSSDTVKYGKIEKIDVISKGYDYDVINPPNLTISDSSGQGADAYVDVSGVLQELRIVDSGFDYQKPPILTITGGNGEGAEVSPTMSGIIHSVEFNSLSISTVDDTIKFTVNHKLKTGESVVYKTNNQQSIGGIVDGSEYFVSVVDSKTISLHETQSDSVSAANKISFTSLGVGNHIIEATETKSVVASLNVVNSGLNYQNKKRILKEENINLQKDCFYIKNHRYESGELIKYYSTTGTAIGGLEIGKEYVVTKISDDEFSISQVGEDNVKEFYNKNQYIDIISVGSGKHTFNCPEIKVSIISEIGLSPVGTETFELKVQPVFRGQVEAVYLADEGSNYGSPEILNYNRTPNLSLSKGSDAQVSPVIKNGEIVDVIVLNQGKNYTSPPNIRTIGDGAGAVLTPIIENGFLRDVNVINGGFGFGQETFIIIESVGQDCKFNTTIQSWNVNLFEKNISNIGADDISVECGLNDKYGLQYSYLYAPRSLRESVFSINSSGEVIYGSKDLKKKNNKETESDHHSPIIGWAYDGSPIYGPYGYSQKNGGQIVQMKSGYKLDLKPNRPSTSIFPEGYFLEDYSYFDSNDESVLDRNNGRFCVTPDYPNGTYAYFSTLDAESVESSGLFAKYKKPQFPYFIGDCYENVPIDFNFEKSSNQDDFIFGGNWARNTSPYNLDFSGKNYKYINVPDTSSQKVVIDSIKSSGIDSISVKSAGDLYKVDDKVLFDDVGSGGNGVSAKVSRISGKTTKQISFDIVKKENIEVSSTNRKNEYLVTSDVPHSLNDGDIVNLNSLSRNFELTGSYPVGVSTNILKISQDILDVSQTGQITYFNVIGNLNENAIRENDILQIGTEKIKVLKINRSNYTIKVLRQFDGTIGSSYPIFTNIIELPRKLKINSKEKVLSPQNKQIYFDPSKSVATGNTFGIGIGVSLLTEDGELHIPTKAIYLKNHGLKTGDSITYSTGGGDGLVVSEDGVTTRSLTDGENLFVGRVSDDLISISTVRVGLDTQGVFVALEGASGASRTLYFDSIGTGENHSFTTNYVSTTGNISRNEVTLETENPHELTDGDEIYLEVNPQETFTYEVSYDDQNRRLIFNKKSFTDPNVSVSENTIYIENHNLSSGDKILYTSDNPSDGLVSGEMYYAIFFNENKIGLAQSYFDSISNNFIDIKTQSSGNIGSINPKISVYRDSTIIFDVSDASLSYLRQTISYSAFKLDFYLDTNLSLFWNDAITNIQRSGRPGVDSDAKITLKINSESPDMIYYKLNPVIQDGLPDSKKYSFPDLEIDGMSTIQVKDSEYSGKYNIKTISDTEVKFNTTRICEKDVYTSDISNINYSTNSKTVSGPIESVLVTNPGKEYTKMPRISSIESEDGDSAILEPFGSSVGEINNVKIENLKKDYPSDETLRPTASFTQILKVEPLYSISSINLTDFGRGYLVPPKLVVKDSVTDEVVQDLDLEYKLGDSEVKIIKNTHRLRDAIPQIIPTRNSNGIGISTISYDPDTHDATITLSTQYSDSSDFPIKPGDKFLVESAFAVPGGLGFNSEDYNYKLFTAISTNESIGGGFGTISYNMSELFSLGDTAGTYDHIRSLGRIIPESYFPKFEVSIEQSDFLTRETYELNETIKGKLHNGTIEYWESETGLMHILSNEIYDIGSIVRGISSKAEGNVISSIRTKSYFPLGSSLSIRKSSNTNSGFLNDSFQRLQDSDYYQNFSYSIKSRIPYETWNDHISPLTHTAGFKKFSDYQIESMADSQTSMRVNISSNSVDQVNDLIGKVNLNSFSDFDLVSENDVDGISNKILFNSKILGDYFESVGNKVLEVDNISNLFNSNPRSTKFSPVATFSKLDNRYLKFITLVKDRRYTQQRQLMIIDLIHDNFEGYINQYGRVETEYDLGSFDYTIIGNQGILLFYPERHEINDYDISAISFNLDEIISSAVDTIIGTSLITTEGKELQGGTSTVFEIDASYSSIKLLLQINPESQVGKEFEVSELNIMNDGSNIHILENTKLSTDLGQNSTVGLGTYHAYIDGSKLKVDFIQNQNTNIDSGIINTYCIALGDENSSGSQTEYLKHVTFNSKSTTIASSPTPSEIVIAEYETEETYNAAHLMVQISDTTNDKKQFSEVIVVDSYESGIPTYETYDTEYGIINDGDVLGEISSRVILDGTYKTQIMFTPIANIDTHVNVFMTALRNQDDTRDQINMASGSIRSYGGIYEGTHSDIKKSFELYNSGEKIFERTFDSQDQDIVNIADDKLNINTHFFVTGESIKYVPGSPNSIFEAIEIEPTSFAGIGVTDRLPQDIFAIKLPDNTLRFASSAENALKSTPEFIKFVNYGVGSAHRIVANNQNTKALLTIDNVIQSPIVESKKTASVTQDVFTTSDIIRFDDTTGFFGTDLIRVNDEIMMIESIGIGSPENVRVRRTQLGTKISPHSAGSTITKLNGNYNIVDNTLNFVRAPYGRLPFSTSTGSPEERDWSGISTSSNFSGRIFLRSGIPNTSSETYTTNYIFDDISDQFNSIQNEFVLKSNSSNVSGIKNGIVIVNDVFQYPGRVNCDILTSDASGISTVKFTGNSRTITNDVGISSFPRGGLIVSVGSSEGLGYQPLITAGGFATINSSGEIDSITMDNVGSGYRAGLQTVNVSAINDPDDIQIIGTANIVDGKVSSVNISNPGSGYSASPRIEFDDPLNYYDLPLIYSANSTGSGQGASINIIVGQESKVIDFSITNTGYGYNVGDKLTVPTSTAVGIETNSNFEEFVITVDKTISDTFSGWTFGELEVLDNIERFIDGENTIFPLLSSNIEKSIISNRGSSIDVKNVLLVFVNNILQIPGEGYIFNGGSTIQFTEPLKKEDTVEILFYKGSGDVDVIPRNIIETVKAGDDLQIINDPSVGQKEFLKEDIRVATEVTSTNVVITNPYYGPGNIDEESLLRPITWTKQTEDKIIDDVFVGKDRELYEASINPISYIIGSVGIGQTVVYVDSLRPTFNSKNENNIDISFQNEVTLISQDEVKVESNDVTSYSGDYGIIVGFGVTTTTSNKIIFDLYIPEDSPLRDSSINETPITVSELSAGDYFSVSNSIVSADPDLYPLISYDHNSGAVVAKTDSYLDSIFVVESAENVDKQLNGITITVRRVYCNITPNGILDRDRFDSSLFSFDSDSTKFDSIPSSQNSGPVYTGTISTSNFIGHYSWGKVILDGRIKNYSYNAYALDGYAGISTSAMVRRTIPLKYNNYTG